MRLALVIVAGALLAFPPPSPTRASAAAPSWQVVSRERLLAAMNGVRGYELTATPNGPRFQAEVLRQLIREQEAQDRDRRPLFLDHGAWYEAFLARTGLAPSAAPLYVRLSHEMEQDVVVDYRREAVVDAVLQGPPPRIVANIRIFWARKVGKPDHYGYDDLVSSPTCG